MPQFDVLTFPSQLFWLLFSFLVLFLFMKYISAPKISATLKQRQEKIETELNEAEDQSREIESYHIKLLARLEEARSKAREITTKAIEAVHRATAQRKGEIARLVTERLDASEAYILQQQQQAAGEITFVSGHVLEAMLEKILHTKVEKSEIAKALEDSLEEKVS